MLSMLPVIGKSYVASHRVPLKAKTAVIGYTCTRLEIWAPVCNKSALWDHHVCGQAEGGPGWETVFNLYIKHRVVIHHFFIYYYYTFIYYIIQFWHSTGVLCRNLKQAYVFYSLVYSLYYCNDSNPFLGCFCCPSFYNFNLCILLK